MEEKKEGAKPYPFLHSILLSHLWGWGEVGEGEAGNKGFLFLLKSTSTQSNV